MGSLAYNHPRFGKDYKWYISGIYIQPIGGWTMPPTDPTHLLGETSIPTIELSRDHVTSGLVPVDGWLRTPAGFPPGILQKIPVVNNGKKPTWRTIPVSKWLITMVSKSPNWGYSPYKLPKWLLNRGY